MVCALFIGSDRLGDSRCGGTQGRFCTGEVNLTLLRRLIQQILPANGFFRGTTADFAAARLAARRAA
jgi:hypothetical protein